MKPKCGYTDIVAIEAQSQKKGLLEWSSLFLYDGACRYHLEQLSCCETTQSPGVGVQLVLIHFCNVLGHAVIHAWLSLSLKVPREVRLRHAHLHRDLVKELGEALEKHRCCSTSSSCHRDGHGSHIRCCDRVQKQYAVDDIIRREKNKKS